MDSRPYGRSGALDKLNKIRKSNPAKCSLADFLEFGAESGIPLADMVTEEDQLRWTTAQDASRTPLARRSYSTRVWDAFLAWAARSGAGYASLATEHDRELAAAAFVSTLTHLGAHGAKAHLSRIRAALVTQGAPVFPRQSDLIRAALRGNEEMSAAVRQDEGGDESRLGLLCPVVHAWLATPAVSQQSSFLRDRALILVALACARRGAHVWQWRLRNFSPAPPPLEGVAAIMKFYTGRGKTKSDSNKVHWVQPADLRGRTLLCPHSALVDYLDAALRAGLQPHDYLFQHTRDGVPRPGGRPLTTALIGDIVQAAAKVAARTLRLNPAQYGAKSLRQGGASMFYLSNLPERKLEHIGGWSLASHTPPTYYREGGAPWPSNLGARATLPAQLGFATDWDEFTRLLKLKGEVPEIECRARILGPLPESPSVTALTGGAAAADAPPTPSDSDEVSSSEGETAMSEAAAAVAAADQAEVNYYIPELAEHGAERPNLSAWRDHHATRRSDARRRRRGGRDLSGPLFGPPYADSSSEYASSSSD